MKLNLLALLILLLICGCGGPARMEQTASELKAGMEKGEVKQLFANYELIEETNRHLEIWAAAKYYSTNKQSSSSLVYKGTAAALESCAVYFDSNNIIIAYSYDRGN